MFDQVCSEYLKTDISLEALVSKYKISRWLLCKEFKTRNIPIRKNIGRTKNLTVDEKLIVAASYASGKTLKDVCSEFEISSNRVKTLVVEYGFELRSRYESKAKYRFNHRYFENVDSEEKAYWLGFIAADGYVYFNEQKPEYRLCIGLAGKDLNHLEKFRKAIGAEHPIKQGERSDGRTWCQISLHSKELLQDLSQWGIIPRKTFLMSFPNIRPELIQHYLRGYFDGDGCWQARPNKIFSFQLVCGDLGFLKECQLKLAEACDLNLTKIHSVASRKHSIHYGGGKQIKRIFDYLYQNATVFLDRKYEYMKTALEVRC